MTLVYLLKLQPDEEEKQLLENNIQMALQANSIELEDAIDIREVRNIKLANQLLKLRRKKKIERDQAIAQQNIQHKLKLTHKHNKLPLKLKFKNNKLYKRWSYKTMHSKLNLTLTNYNLKLNLKNN